MNRGLFFDRPEHLFLEEFPDRELKSDEIRIQSEFSAIKHGTDFHIFSGKSPFETMNLDSELRMFVPKTPEQITEHGKRPFGNTTVGTVLEVGSNVTSFKKGDRIYAYGPIAERAVVLEKYANLLEEPMTPQDAVCMDPAYYAYAAVRDSRARLGDNVVVSGLGAIGMFVVQQLKLSGCMEIIAIDPIQKRRDLAAKFGATLVLNPMECDTAMEIHKYLGGRGADVAIEASGSYRALRDVMRSVQKCGTIVTLGYYKESQTELCLGYEWHHNRLNMISSMPTWGNPLREYPIWDEERLMRTLREMFKKKLLSSEGIVDPIVPLDQAVDTIMDIYRNAHQAIKTGVTYRK